MSGGENGGGAETEIGRWLRYAREDLQTASSILELAVSPPRHACLLAQQGAEKALKALLLFLKVGFPRTHDLDLLRTLLPEDFRAKSDPVDVAGLSEWAVESRYPGDWPDATHEEAAEAVETASAVAWAVAADLAVLGWPGGSSEE